MSIAGALLLSGFCWLLYIHPELDLAVSNWFFDRGSGHFLLQDSVVTSWLLDVLQLLGLALPALLLALLLCYLIRVPSYRCLPSRAILIYLLLASTIVPGLAVNALKIYYGRSRPVHVAEFGGTNNFSPLLVVSGSCRKNCSFVSGDVSEAFVPLALALLATSHRRFYLAVTFLFGCGVALVKVMQGRHFLTDVVMAGALTVLINYEFYCFFTKYRNAPSS